MIRDVFDGIRGLKQEDASERALQTLLDLERLDSSGLRKGDIASAVTWIKVVRNMPGFERRTARLVGKWVTGSETAASEYSEILATALEDQEALKFLSAVFENLGERSQQAMAGVLGAKIPDEAVSRESADMLSRAAQAGSANSRPLSVSAVFSNMRRENSETRRRLAYLVSLVGEGKEADWVLETWGLARDELLGNDSLQVRQLCQEYWARCPDERALEILLVEAKRGHSGLVKDALSSALSLAENRTVEICRAIAEGGVSLELLLGACRDSDAFIDLVAVIEALAAREQLYDLVYYPLKTMAEKRPARSREGLLGIARKASHPARSLAIRLLGSLGFDAGDLARLVEGNPVVAVYDLLADASPKQGKVRQTISGLMKMENPSATDISVPTAGDGMELTVWSILSGCGLQVVPAEHFGYPGVDFVCISGTASLLVVGVTGAVPKDDLAKLVGTVDRLQRAAPDRLRALRWLALIFAQCPRSAISPEAYKHAAREGVGMVPREELQILMRLTAAGMSPCEFLAWASDLIGGQAGPIALEL